MLTVYKIECDGSSYLEQNLGNIQEMLSEMDEGSSYTITKTTIEQEKYDTLKEFTGF